MGKYLFWDKSASQFQCPLTSSLMGCNLARKKRGWELERDTYRGRESWRIDLISCAAELCAGHERVRSLIGCQTLCGEWNFWQVVLRRARGYWSALVVVSHHFSRISTFPSELLQNPAAVQDKPDSTNDSENKQIYFWQVRPLQIRMLCRAPE